MATVLITASARQELDDLPIVIHARVLDIFERLEKWPAVSGVKPLKRDLAGSWRIRTGDYRVVFRVSANGEIVTVWKIGDRGGVYE